MEAKPIRLLAGLLAVGSCGAAGATSFTATFDEFQEGYFASDLGSGGVHFYAIDQNLGGGDNFTIEASNSGDLGAWFSQPNVLGFGGYSPGSGTSFGRLKSFRFALTDPNYALRSTTLEIWTFLLQTYGNTVTLEGWYQNQLVNSTTFTPATFVIDHRTLSLPTDDYDEFRILAQGSVDNGVVFADVDNVHIEANPVPEPGSLIGLALGGLLLRYRRRS